MARRALSAFSRWALEDAYTDLLDFCDSLQRRVSKLVDDVRILRQKYASAKAENMDLIWIRLVGPGRLLGGLPAMDDAVVESDAIMGDYRLGATLGVGSSAVVREGVDERSGERLAIKIVDKSRAARYKIVRRLNNGSQLVAGCCAVRAASCTTASSPNVLVAPGVEDGQVAAVRLTDLGMSETYEPGQRGTAFCGSRASSRRRWSRRRLRPFKVDAWSIGCVALELLLGRQWFSDRWLPASKLTGDPRSAAVAAATPPGDGDDELESLDAVARGAFRAADAFVEGRRPDLAASLATITDAAAPNAAPEGDVPVDVTVEMEPLRARFLSRGELDEGRNAP
ncbi:protein kinase [Aureococcus anophagefferens]|nr:protein kinase [Aureococcus anophagefferens]